MTDELVDNIVRQVLAVLGRQGVAVPAAPAAGVAPAVAPAVAPPAVPSASPASAATSNGRRPAPPVPPTRTFLTAEMLLHRLADGDGNGRVIELAHHEFLTPAARDVIDERHLTVRKAPASLPAPKAVAAGGSTIEALAGALAGGAGPAGAQAAAAAVGLVVERPSQTVRSVLAALAHDRLGLVDYTQTDCWIANTQGLCRAVLAGGVRAGVAILPHAADAMVLANKLRGIRAVQGTRAESVRAAIRHFAPNLLILEHAVSTYHEMRAMVRMFAGERPGPPAAKVLMETVAELEKG